MPQSEKDRAANSLVELKIDFEMALGDNRRKFPVQEFEAFRKAAHHYLDMTAKDKLIHREVARAINGFGEYLQLRRKRVPGDVLYELERLECILFSGYDPHFEGDEPPGL